MRHLFFGLVVLLACATFSASAEITLTSAKGTDSPLVAEVQRTIDGFNEFIEQKLGVTLVERITVHICPNEECYYLALRENGGYGSWENAGENSRNTGGMAFPAKGLILLKLEDKSGLTWARHVTAHELTHILQKQLAVHASSFHKAPAWIIEGMADFVAAQVANQLGNQSVESWRLSLLSAVRMNPNASSVNAIRSVTYQGWRSLLEEQRSPYQVADLMFLDLIDQPGKNKLLGLPEYFTCMDTFSFESTCFRDSFGLDPDTFFRDYAGRFKASRERDGELLVVTKDVEVESASHVKNAVQAARKQIRTLFGAANFLDVVWQLSPDRAEMSLLISQETGMSPQQSAALHSFYWQANKVYLNVGRVSSPEHQAALSASITADQFIQTQGDWNRQVTWLRNGLSEEISVQVLNAMGLRSLEQSERRATETLENAPRGLPTLAEIQTNEGYVKARHKYGDDVVTQYAACAAKIIVAHNGMTTVNEWMRRSRVEANREVAYARSFGSDMSADRIEEKLRASLKGKT